VKCGSKIWPYAVTREKNRNPKLTMVNQWARATTGSRAIRVCPRNSRTSVVVRTAGLPVRVRSGSPSRTTCTMDAAARVSRATPAAVRARLTTMTAICSGVFIPGGTPVGKRAGIRAG
jgi:hypothetical protein